MRARHNIQEGQDDDFGTMTPKDAMQLQRQALDIMSTLGGISSIISFAVGGLGILSIMILVVRARRVEIGVRRAVGGAAARHRAPVSLRIRAHGRGGRGLRRGHDRGPGHRDLHRGQAPF